VALARVLARRPGLLLLDEPLSALDAPTREQLRPELRRALAAFDVPVILVTHERAEALSLADHLVVMDKGRVFQQGPADEVFRRPAGRAVARVVGVDTIEAGRALNVESGLATVAVGDVRLLATVRGNPGPAVDVCIRAKDVTLWKGVEWPITACNRLEGRVR